MTTRHNFHPAYRPDIDGLRGVAILSVVVFHAFPEALQGGFIGVDIFFVISGYLISSILLKSLADGDFSFMEFYARRVKRIFPALIVVLAATFTLGWFTLLADEFSQLGKHMAAGAGFVQNFVLWGEAGYFDTASELKPLMHLWSLAIEEQFYLLYPLLLWLGWRLRLNLLVLLAVLTLLSFGANVAGVEENAVRTFFMPQTRFWELFAGGLLAHVQLHHAGAARAMARRGIGLLPWLGRRVTDAGREALAAQVCSLAGVALILAGLLSIHRGLPFPGTWALLPVLGAVLLIQAGPQAGFNRWVLANPLMVFIGLISYPLYLWHWPLLSLARIVESELPSETWRAGLVAASVLLAWLTYRLVERPIRFGRKFPGRLLLLVLVMALLGGVGYETFRRDGLPERKVLHASDAAAFTYSYRELCVPWVGKGHLDDWCNRGNAPERAPTMVLVGDSFANTYAEMMKAYLAASGSDEVFVQFGRGQCPALPGYGPEYCRELTGVVQDYLRRTPSIHTVVLAAHWPSYFDGKDFSWVGHQEDGPAFVRAFENAVDGYLAAGKRVVVFLPQPVGVNPRACVLRPFRLTSRNTCDLGRPSARHHDGEYRGTLIPFLDTRQVPVFDPFRYLCNDTTCQVTNGTQVLYADVQHLNARGARYLAQVGQRRLDKLFGGPAR